MSKLLLWQTGVQFFWAPLREHIEDNSKLSHWSFTKLKYFFLCGLRPERKKLRWVLTFKYFQPVLHKQVLFLQPEIHLRQRKGTDCQTGHPRAADCWDRQKEQRAKSPRASTIGLRRKSRFPIFLFKLKKKKQVQVSHVTWISKVNIFVLNNEYKKEISAVSYLFL